MEVERIPASLLVCSSSSGHPGTKHLHMSAKGIKQLNKKLLDINYPMLDIELHGHSKGRVFSFQRHLPMVSNGSMIQALRIPTF